MALFCTILTVFISMMISQNLSSGSIDMPPGPANTPTPPPSYGPGIEPNTPSPIEPDRTSYLTNDQRYYKELFNADSTNILLLGTDPTGFNFDTIMIVNIDKITRKLTLLSLPRDIYIDYSDLVLDALMEHNPSYLKEKGMNRINAAPSIGNFIKYKEGEGGFNKPYVDFLVDIIDEVFEIEIDDYAYVKTRGFRNLVDYFGGVTVYVPVHMEYNDPYQDLEIYIEKGTQHLYGPQSEGYVRFRQGFDEEGIFHNYGDIFRKNNQNRFIKAFISQHVTLRNLGKLPKISEIISSNINTSVKGWDQIVKYGALAEDAVNNNYPIDYLNLDFAEKNIDGSSYIIIETK